MTPAPDDPVPRITQMRPHARAIPPLGLCAFSARTRWRRGADLNRRDPSFRACFRASRAFPFSRESRGRNEVRRKSSVRSANPRIDGVWIWITRQPLIVRPAARRFVTAGRYWLPHLFRSLSGEYFQQGQPAPATVEVVDPVHWQMQRPRLTLRLVQKIGHASLAFYV